MRKAFTADTSKGHTLVVADYGQLELRILAHLANCKSMQAAFLLGGDFHSRTALGMYDHIKEAINNGALLRAKHWKCQLVCAVVCLLAVERFACMGHSTCF